MSTYKFLTHKSRIGLLILLMRIFAIPVFAAGNTEGLAADRETKLRQFLRNLDTQGGRYDRDIEFRVVVNFSDLNGNGSKEAVVYLLGDKYCGSGGCNLLVLEPHGDTWRTITAMTIVKPPVYLLAHKSHGWHDLGVSVSGAGIGAPHIAELRFNGKSYPRNPTLVPAQRLKGKPVSKVNIPSTKGAVLLYK